MTLPGVTAGMAVHETRVSKFEGPWAQRQWCCPKMEWEAPSVMPRRPAASDTKGQRPVFLKLVHQARLESTFQSNEYFQILFLLSLYKYLDIFRRLFLDPRTVLKMET